MKRAIIEIDEVKCTGCSQCIPNCPEGALQVIDGTARMVSDLFCDGLGACIGHCPEGAIRIIEREAEPYDERKVMENIVSGGENVIVAHLHHLKDHSQEDYYRQAVAFLEERGIGAAAKQVETGHHHDGHGCPGAQTIDMRSRENREENTGDSSKWNSELRNWPVQLQLLNPTAPYLQNADLLVVADCVPFAYADFHRRFLKEKVVITFCPKLDRSIEQYIEKLTLVFQKHQVRSVSVLHMEVPCCSGTLQIVEEALCRAGRAMPVKEYTISIGGEII